MLDIFSEEPQINKKTTPISEEVGLGLLRGGVNFLEFGAMLGLGFASSEEEDEKTTEADGFYDTIKKRFTKHPMKGLVRREDLYNIIVEDLEPLKQKLTPDPGSSSAAGKFFGALSELPLQLLAGPPGMIGSAVTQTSMELIDAGVDAKTVIPLGIASGVTTAALIKIPGGGKTIGKTLGLISVNPVTGALQRAGTKTVLEEAGYKEQAEMYDPFDPAAIGVDLALGAFGGVLGHKQAKKYANLRKNLTTEVEDAIDVIANKQKINKATPFEPSIKSNTVNHQAMEKALSDISEGKAVDVSEVLNEATDLKIRKNQFPEEIYTKKAAEKTINELNGTLKPFEDIVVKEPIEVLQKLEDITEQAHIVRNIAETKQAKLDAVMDSVVKENNLPEYIGTPKSVKSIIEKVIRKNDPEYNIYSIKDHTRGIIVLNDLTEVPKVIESLKSKTKIFSSEASINEPLNQFGYRGIHIITDMQDGIKGEIQLHSKESLEIKKITDETYRKWRNYSDKDIKQMSHEEMKMYKADIEKSQALWTNFWDKIDPSVKESASSAVKGLESVIMPTVSSSTADSLHIPPIKTKGFFPEDKGLKSTTEPLSEPPLSKPKSDISSPPDSIIPKAKQIVHLLNDPIEARVESFLQDKDIYMLTGKDDAGNPIYKSSREVIDEARLEIEKTQEMQKLYTLAADCLRLGGE